MGRTLLVLLLASCAVFVSSQTPPSAVGTEAGAGTNETTTTTAAKPATALEATEEPFMPACGRIEDIPGNAQAASIGCAGNIAGKEKEGRERERQREAE